ncbi:type II toxin-antitoxin system toxin VapC [Uliginosibacterium sediminicola]
MLDTNICIYLINGHPDTVRQHFARYDVEDIAISSIVAGELYYGTAKSGSKKNFFALEAFLNEFEILPFERIEAIRTGELRAFLAQKGSPIGPYDVQIAAHALTQELTLVTNNEREFRRVPGLKIENWIA